MSGYCHVCGELRNNVVWDKESNEYRCPGHGADWTEIHQLCERLSVLLEANDPPSAYQINDWQRRRAEAVKDVKPVKTGEPNAGQFKCQKCGYLFPITDKMRTGVWDALCHICHGKWKDRAEYRRDSD